MRNDVEKRDRGLLVSFFAEQGNIQQIGRWEVHTEKRKYFLINHVV